MSEGLLSRALRGLGSRRDSSGGKLQRSKPFQGQDIIPRSNNVKSPLQSRIDDEIRERRRKRKAGG